MAASLPTPTPAAWIKQLGGRLYVRNCGAEVIATVELTSAGSWHAYVSEPGCSWSYSETFTEQATAIGAADTAAAWWQLHASDEAGTVVPALPVVAPATLGDDVVVESSYCRRLTVSADLRPLGRGRGLFPVITVEDDWEAEDEDTRRELGSSIPLDPDQAERLGHALLAAAAAARTAGGAR